MRLIFIALIILYQSFAFAQNTKDRSGFIYGGGVGAGVASGKNALFYNGAPGTPNAIVNILGNYSYKETIYNVLQDDIKNISYPSKMTYNPSVTLQGYLGYVVKNKNSFFSQLTYSTYSTDGVFSIELASQNTDSKIENRKYVDGGIKASESRVDIEIGYHISLVDYSHSNIPFCELVANINTVAVKSHQMQLETFSSSLIHYDANNYYTNQAQGGTGYGFGLVGGIEFPYKDKMCYSVGLKAMMKKIHLLDNATLTPHGEIFFRVLL